MQRRAFLALTAGFGLLAGLQGSATPVPPAGLLSDVVWTMDDPRFGGFSAIEVQPDGLGFVALSDKGAFVRGRFERDGEGRIARITASPPVPLKGQGEEPLRPGRTDSEGLAMAPDGSAWVSFEGPARVLRYARLNGPAENLPSPPEFARMQPNSALEALAIGPDGTLYTLPERSGGEKRPFPVYRFRNGTWDHDLSIPRSGGYLAVAADIGPDGRFYLLERQFRGLAGFSTRLRRFDLGKTLTGETTLLQTPVGLHANLEGMSVWRDGAGRLTATLIADDRFSFLFATRIIEYRLHD